MQWTPKEKPLIFILAKIGIPNQPSAFQKSLGFFACVLPRVTKVAKNPVYPIAIQELKEEKSMPFGTQIRQHKYLNNIIEQDHRFIKKRVRSMLGLKSFQTAKKILSGIEVMHMLRKKQVFLRERSVQNQKQYIYKLFGLTA